MTAFAVVDLMVWNQLPSDQPGYFSKPTYDIFDSVAHTLDFKFY